MARKLIVEIIGDSRSLERSFQKAGAETHRFGGALHALAGAAKVASLAISAGLVVALDKSIKAAEEQDKVAAQTAAALKSTGNAAGVSAKHITALAESLQNVSGISRTSIQDAENRLLAFTNVTGKGFDRATKAILDFSVRTGRDAATSATIFGKALADPAKKLGGLARAGIVFNAVQTKTIKGLAEHGKLQKAQALILAQVEKRYGGAAKAAGATFGGQVARLKLQLRDLEIRIGEKVIPVLIKLADWFTRHGPEIRRIATEVFDGIKRGVDAALPTLEHIVAFFQRNWPAISRALEGTARVIKAIFVVVWPIASAAVRNAARAIIPLVQSIARVIKGVVEIISGLLHGDWTKIWRGFKDVAAGEIKGIKTLILFEVKETALAARVLGHAIAAGLKAGLKALEGVAEAIFHPIVIIIDKLTAAVRTLLGLLHKVSRVHFPHLPHVPLPHIPTGGLPHFASGGIVTGPTLAMIGERGPEAVVPLGALGGITITGPIHLHGVRDPDDFLRRLQQKAQRSSASRAGRLGGINLGLS